MAKVGYVPMRMCAVTRERLPKKDLVRLAIDEGRVVIDEAGKVRSRGVNIKPETEIFDKFVKQNGFKRHLEVTVSKEEAERLKGEFEAYIERKFGEKKVVRISSDKLNDILSGNAKQ